MNMYREMIQNPEQDTEPPEDFYITADCGHEVYQGEILYEWDNKYICPDCMEEKLAALSLPEQAAMMGVEFTTVKRRRRYA